MSDEDIVGSVTIHGLSGGEAEHFAEENSEWLRGRKTPYGTVVPIPIGFRSHAVSIGSDADHIIPSEVEDMIRRNTEPKTPTGKRYWDLEEWDGDPADILAIEREAAQQERERLRRKLRREMPRNDDWPQFGPLADGRTAARAAWDMATDMALDLLADPEEADRPTGTGAYRDGPCSTDLCCYRSDGHDGDHAYPEEADR